ncbi:MAG: MerR family transcriptional regulator [Gemmatimonadota bacterium]|nr:MAG: MerR family transcriptional regulator [Gemmatimonadota bacterium]
MKQQLNARTPRYPIRDVAKRFDLSNATLRKYERAGLLIPFRKTSQHRLFSEEDIRRVDFIVKAIREDGLNLEGVRRLMALLPCWELKPCTIKNKENCPAFHEYKNPCWMIEETLCPHNSRDCRNCQVYRQSIENVKYLKEYMIRSNRKGDRSKYEKH